MSSSTISDYLLAPMEASAVVVNDAVLSHVTFFDSAYNYENVPNFLTPAPTPFDHSAGQPSKGVHLHWEIPAALRQGNQATETGPIEFPHVPNRWLVLRYWPGQSSDNRQMKGWVLLSDHTGADGTNSFLDPNANTPTPTKVGKNVDLASFSEPNNAQFLKGIGPGNLTFSTFRVNAQNVFSFNDDLSDLNLQPTDAANLSCMIVGWFSQASSDPLNGATDAAKWAAATGQLQWLTNPSPYAIAGASPPQKAFGLTGYGDLSSTFAAGAQFSVAGSTGNDGTYTVDAGGAVWDQVNSHLTIPVTDASSMTSATAGGTAGGYIVPPGAPALWPTQTLIHAWLYDVKWPKSTDLPVRRNSTPPEVANNVKLSIGNSAIDALGAMIVAEARSDEGEDEQQAQADAAALEAFQANLLPELDKAGGQAQLDKELRSKWFAPENGGTLWVIVNNPDWKSNGANFPPNSAQEAWLAQLNYFQQGLDRETRVFTAMQYDLYALWWRTQSINAGSYTRPASIPENIWDTGNPPRVPPAKQQITDSLPNEAAAVHAQKQNVDAWQAKIDGLIAAPPSYQSGTTTVAIQTPGQTPATAPPLLLKADKMPRFYEPVDPVVLVSGLGASVNQTNASKAGQEALPCRLGSQHITAITVDSTAIEASSLGPDVPTPSGTSLPAGIEAATGTLVLESMLLDPDNASLINKISGKPTADISAAIRAGNAYTGKAPDPISAAQWQQAWIPLLLDWELTYYPTQSSSIIDAGNYPNWEFIRDGWEFDGLDYNWTGGDVSTPTAGGSADTYTISSVDTGAKSFTLNGVGNLGWRFPAAAEFTVEGTSAPYAVSTTSCDADGNFTIVVSGAVESSQASKTLTRKVLAGGQVTYKGRTFLTPKATFNFRAKLQQYIEGHGGRYSIHSIDQGAKSFTVDTSRDLSAFFLPGNVFYVAQSTSGNNGAYTVASRTYDSGARIFTVVANESIPSATATGVLVSEALADAAHLIDIIGGARYQITNINSGAKSVTVSTEVDLNHLFTVSSTFYLAETEHSNGIYTVASTSYNETANTFTIVANEAIAQSNPNGVAVPEPQQWDLLSQSLSGFTEQLLTRDVNPNQVASGTVASGGAQGQKYSDLIGDQDYILPMLSIADGIDPAQGRPTPYFFPMRGGFFAISGLTLVDRFGQSVNLLAANKNPSQSAGSFEPVRSRWVTPEAGTHMANKTQIIKMPPRSALAGRLNFRFVSAPDTDAGAVPPDTDIDLAAGANPVAGWILPNHLDNGLLVYDADGNSLGELVLSQTGATPATRVEWFPVPMAANPITDPKNPTTGIQNQYLRGFVAGILDVDANQQGQAFANFLQAVDETLWTVDPLGGRADQNLSVLVGRPLALVRSRVELVTDGPPDVDQGTFFAIPSSYPVSAASTSDNSFSFAMTENIAGYHGQWEGGAQISIAGSSGNDGVYHIARTAYDGSSTFTVYVKESVNSATAGGNIAPRPPAGDLTNTPFKLRLGRPDLFDDGLIGYYIGDDYSKCYNVHALEDYTPAGYLYPIGQNGENYLSLTYNGEATQGGPPTTPAPAANPNSIFLTMLIDPRGTVNATTGILPTEELTLPAQFYQTAVASLEIYFRTGPLMVDPEAIRMPRPTEQNGSWNWIQKNATGNAPTAWEADPVAKSVTGARFPSQPLELRDGWLKLTGTDLED